MAYEGKLTLLLRHSQLEIYTYLANILEAIQLIGQGPHLILKSFVK